MNNIDDLILDTKKTLFEHPLIKEYFRLRNEVKNSKEIEELASNMKIHEKEMTQNMNDDETYFKEKALFEEYKNKYENHPLMVDYVTISNEVYDLLLEVKSILN